MNSDLLQLTKQIEKNPPVDPLIFQQTLAQLDFAPPADYVDFIKEFNGGEGPIGDYNYLQLWKIEDLIPMNEKYEVNKYAEGYFIFGSNAGGTAYAFAKKSAAIVTFEFVGMAIADEPVVIGKDFFEFLTYLYRN